MRGEPSSAGLAFDHFTVQRASRSFCDDGGVDDLASHRQEACPSQGCLVGPEQHLDRGPAAQGGTRQRLAEGPDRVRVRHRIGQPEPEKAHERKPVLDQELGPLVRQAVAGLQDQHLPHQHMVERRTTAATAVGARHSPLQIRPEKLKIHQTIQPLKRVALRRKLLQTLLNIEEPGLTPHPTPPFAIRSRNHNPEERARRYLEVSRCCRCSE